MEMLRKLIKRIKDQKGVTLIELLAVIVILGIIAAIAIPNILNLKKDASTSVYQTNAKTMTEVAKRVILVKSEAYSSSATENTDKNYSLHGIAAEVGIAPEKVGDEYAHGDNKYVLVVNDDNTPGYYELNTQSGDVTFVPGDAPDKPE